LTAVIPADSADWWKGHHEGRGPLPWQCYRDAILACGKAYQNWGQTDLPLAARYLKGIDAGHTVHFMGGRPLDLVSRVWPQFYDHGRVGVPDRCGREPTWEAADAKRIAAILKGGKKGHMFRGGQRVERLVYFTSMNQAVCEDTEAAHQWYGWEWGSWCSQQQVASSGAATTQSGCRMGSKAAVTWQGLAGRV